MNLQVSLALCLATLMLQLMSENSRHIRATQSHNRQLVGSFHLQTYKGHSLLHKHHEHFDDE